MDKNMADEGAELLRKFMLLPKRYAGRELLVQFTNNGHFCQASISECTALKFPFGETIVNHTLSIEPSDKHHNIYAQREMAERIIVLPEGTVVNAKVRTLHAIGSESNALSERTVDFKGLLILYLL